MGLIRVKNHVFNEFFIINSLLMTLSQRMITLLQTQLTSINIDDSGNSLIGDDITNVHINSSC